MKYFLPFICLLASCDIAHLATINQQNVYKIENSCADFTTNAFEFHGALYFTINSNSDSLLINTDSIKILNERGEYMNRNDAVFFDSKENKVKRPISYIKKGKSLKCIFPLPMKHDSILIIPNTGYLSCLNLASAHLKDLEIQFK